MKSKKLLSSLAVVALVAWATSAHAAVITYQDGVGGYNQLMRQISATSGVTGTGATSSVGVVSTATGSPMRSISSFVLSDIPTGATIDSVTFTLEVNSPDSAHIAGVELHNITNSNTIVEGGANLATNWTSITTTNLWTTPGGDFDATAMSSILVTSGGDGDSLWELGEDYTFATSAAFVAAAQSALDSSTPLQFILRSAAQEALGTRGFTRFEGTTSANTRPILTVNFTPIPEPASWMLVASALGLVSIKRRRR